VEKISKNASYEYIMAMKPIKISANDYGTNIEE